MMIIILQIKMRQKRYMKNWSNKQHEETLRLKREKKRVAQFSKLLPKQTMPTTVYLDNNNEISTAIYTNNGVDYYDGNGDKVQVRRGK